MSCIGPHRFLSWSELACHDRAKTPYPVELEYSEVLDDLVEMFEAIRGEYGRPIKIVSAYRTPAYNRSVGGVPNSTHTRGLALDIRPVRGSLSVLVWAVEHVVSTTKLIRGVGHYTSFVHVDCRGKTGDRLARWSGR